MVSAHIPMNLVRFGQLMSRICQSNINNIELFLWWLKISFYQSQQEMFKLISPVGLTSDYMTVQLKDLSIDEKVGA